MTLAERDELRRLAAAVAGEQDSIRLEALLQQLNEFLERIDGTKAEIAADD